MITSSLPMPRTRIEPFEFLSPTGLSRNIQRIELILNLNQLIKAKLESCQRMAASRRRPEN